MRHPFDRQFLLPKGCILSQQAKQWLFRFRLIIEHGRSRLGLTAPTLLQTIPAMSPARLSSAGPAAAPDLFASYAAASPSVYDECRAPDGTIRPAWQEFAAQVAGIGADALAQRFARADAHLAGSGVVHRVYGDGEGVRPWPLSHMPVIISAAEWATLAAGVIARAEWLNTILCDAYGEAALVGSGDVPAALYAASPEFARPMVRPPLRDRQPLRFFAVDLARKADGQWCVLSDRTQAPSGAGYALENRVALSRALPDLYRTMQVERLAGFFQDFRAHLVSLKRNPESRIALMSPGPMNETWFEHSYLARYLGFVLVEGDDLVVRDGSLFIRTVAGLRPCDVLWRRVDSDFTDPLEFNMRSRLGVPGLAMAARQGGVTLANALGSGLAESRALMALLPVLAARAGRPLHLRSQATWWGIDRASAHLIAERFDSLQIGSAFGAPLPGIGTGAALGSSLRPEDKAELLARLAHRGADIVAQEPVQYATTPVYENGALVARPFVLRVFAAFTGQGWQVMPGGLARISDNADAGAISLQRGGRSADVWIVSDAPVAQTSLLRGADAPRVRRSPGSLPSRAADNLFWLGRYAERVEWIARLGRAALARTDRNEADIYSAIAATLVSLGALPPFVYGNPPSPSELGRVVLNGAGLSQTVAALSRAALAAASGIRDRFSPDAWRVLNELVALLEKPLNGSLADLEADDRMRDALRALAAFSGLAQENMNRLIGWRFLDLGRRIERGIGMARLVERFASDDPWACDLLLELGDSTLTYRLRYVDVPERVPVIDLLMLDPANPRSVAFQMQRIAEHFAAVPNAMPEGRLSPAASLAMTLQTELATADATRFDASLPGRIADGLMRLSEEVARAHIRPADGKGGAA